MRRFVINFTPVRAEGLTFVYRGHRCKNSCYSWQKMKRQHCSEVNKNLPSWAADRIAAVSCITNPVHRERKGWKNKQSHPDFQFDDRSRGVWWKDDVCNLTPRVWIGVLAPGKSQIAGLGFSLWWSCLWSECLQKLQWGKTSERAERLRVIIERRDHRSRWTGQTIKRWYNRSKRHHNKP